MTVTTSNMLYKGAKSQLLRKKRMCQRSGRMIGVRMVDAYVLYWYGGDVVRKMEQRRQRFPVRIVLIHE